MLVSWGGDYSWGRRRHWWWKKRIEAKMAWCRVRLIGGSKGSNISAFSNNVESMQSHYETHYMFLSRGKSIHVVSFMGEGHATQKMWLALCVERNKEDGCFFVFWGEVSPYSSSRVILLLIYFKFNRSYLLSLSIWFICCGLCMHVFWQFS